MKKSGGNRQEKGNGKERKKTKEKAKMINDIGNKMIWIVSEFLEAYYPIVRRIYNKTPTK